MDLGSSSNAVCGMANSQLERASRLLVAQKGGRRALRRYNYDVLDTRPTRKRFPNNATARMLTVVPVQPTFRVGYACGEIPINSKPTESYLGSTCRQTLTNFTSNMKSRDPPPYASQLVVCRVCSLFTQCHRSITTHPPPVLGSSAHPKVRECPYHLRPGIIPLVA